MSARPSRVLLVEDDQSIRSFVSLVLADEGYEVRTAANGQDGLTILSAWHPDLILLDLLMPEMDGRAFRAAQLGRKDTRDIPVIVLSAARDLEGEVSDLGPVASIAKPFELEDLLEAVTRVLGSNEPVEPT